MPDIHETLSSPWPASPSSSSLPVSLSFTLSLSLERGLVPLRESLGSVRRACNLSYSLAVDTDGIKHGVCIQCPTKVLVSLGFRENFREGFSFFFFFFGRKEGRRRLDWCLLYRRSWTQIESNITCVLYSVGQKFSDLFFICTKGGFLKDGFVSSSWISITFNLLTFWKMLKIFVSSKSRNELLNRRTKIHLFAMDFHT